MSRRRERAALSEEFLAANRPRLDAIGPWTVEADDEDLEIRWAGPAGLASTWRPLRLRFYTVGGPPFDPDERMFSLWETFRSRQDEFVGQIRHLTDEMADQVGAVERATVVVYREVVDDPDDDEDPHTYGLEVWLTFDGDPEHLYRATYFEEDDAFTGIDI